MSQFPLEGGNPVTTLYRGRDTRGVGQPGITETPNAPGLVPLPPQVSRGQRMAAELMQAFGIAGDLGRAVDRFNTQQQIDAARREDTLKKKQNEIDAAERGVATTNTLTDLPAIEQQIRDGKIAPFEGESVDDFARRVLRVDDQSGIGSAAYQDRRYELGAPRVADVLSNVAEKRAETARKEQLTTVMSGAAGAADMDAIDKIVAGVRNIDPNIPETDAKRDAIALALNYQAKFGPLDNPEKFNTFASASNGLLSEDDIAAAVQTRDTRQKQAAMLTNQQFDDELASGIMQARNGATTLDMLESEIKTKWKGKVGEEKLLDGIEKIDGYRNSINARVKEEAKQQIRASWENQIVSSVQAQMQNANATGGSAMLPQKFEQQVTLADGSKMNVSMTRQEAVSAAISAEMDQITKTSTPDRAFSDQVAFLARNGETYDTWARIMQAGGAAMMSDLSSTDPKKPVVVPRNAIVGYSLWKEIGKENRTIRDRHVEPSSDVAKIYELASVVEETSMLPAIKPLPAGATPGQIAANVAEREKAAESSLALAIQATAQRRSNPEFGAEDIEKVNKAASVIEDGGWAWFDADTKNPGDLKDRILRTARSYVAVLSHAPDQAIEKAIENVKANTAYVNGYGVNVTGRIVPNEKEFQPFAKNAIYEYVAAHPNEGVEEKDLTLVPGTFDSTWILFNARLHKPVQEWNTKGLFTNAQIISQARDAAMQNTLAKKRNKTRLWIDVPPPVPYQVPMNSRTTK